MLIENADYFIRKIDFPNCASRAVCVENDDGTFSVFVNARCTDAQIRARFPHELHHMERNHFHDERSIREIEGEADDET